MKQKTLKRGGCCFFVKMIAAMSVLPWMAHAAVHVVQFGGALGFSYSPAVFSAVVGDTVRWSGNSFETHPLSSTSIPSGAATWHVTAGTVFNYVITTPGTYNYQCDFHVAQGMTGSFTVSGSTLHNSARVVEPGPAISVRTASGTSTATLYLVSPAEVTIALYSLNGKESDRIVRTRLGPGAHVFPIKSTHAGVHVVRVNAGEQELSATITTDR